MDSSTLLFQNSVVVVATGSSISNYPTCSVHALSSSSCYSLSIFAKNNNKLPSKLSTYRKQQQQHNNNISCKSTTNKFDTRSTGAGDINKFDRRDVLLGLGGLYGIAANLGLTNNQSAIAKPVEGPDIKTCGDATVTSGKIERTIQYSCCPKFAAPVKYEIPNWSETYRTRPAAHSVNEEYLLKYSKAIKTMKTLPKDDPHNFWNQAKIHCSYCNGAFKQLGKENPGVDYQVHFNWLFLPFHRWYLYFFERIVAKYTRGLEGQGVIDEDFALPFWNWDNPSGMKIPSIYLDPHQGLHDCYRNPNHLDKLVNLSSFDFSVNMPDEDRIADNLSAVHGFMFKDPSAFLGGRFEGGNSPPNQAGTIETNHNFVHGWTGDPFQPFGEDMGNFYSAAKDPIFYGHHANIDRLWNVWKTLDKTHNMDSQEYDDWKGSAFLFYDENKTLVSVTAGDCEKTESLGYVYQNVDNRPWIRAKQTPKVYQSKLAANSKFSEAANVVFPVTLDKVVQVLLNRPSKSESEDAKDTVAEVLVLEGIEYTMDKLVDFDVYINDEGEKDHARPCNTEYLGCFTRLLHTGDVDSRLMKGMARMSIPLTEVLKDLGAENDDAVVIKLVPRVGAEDVKVREIKIDFAPRK